MEKNVSIVQRKADRLESRINGMYQEEKNRSKG